MAHKTKDEIVERLSSMWLTRFVPSSEDDVRRGYWDVMLPLDEYRDNIFAEIKRQTNAELYGIPDDEVVVRAELLGFNLLIAGHIRDKLLPRLTRTRFTAFGMRFEYTDGTDVVWHEVKKVLGYKKAALTVRVSIIA